MTKAAALPEAAIPAKEPVSEAAAPKAEEKRADAALPDSAHGSSPKTKKRKKERCGCCACYPCCRPPGQLLAARVH